MNSQAQKLIQIAEGEVGYLEKANNNQLNDKTANAGKANWTKYGKWYGQGKNGYAWCAMFVSWCASMAGISTDIIPRYHSSTAGMNWFKQLGQFDKNPKPGDVIFFGSGSTAQHTGIVRAVDAGRVYTVEGNTSGGSTLIANGGGVAKKSYPLSYAKILGYGHPDYEDSEIEKYKTIIQDHCNFSNPDGVFSLTDKSPWAKDLYRKWAESYN